ncbi:MAG: esterase family protein [Candidatus Rokubacteria bacterium]|nr:esterase family protein [Candidatus Rokubacteria bacterium]
MQREHVFWDSPALGRKMELLCFGHAGRPMLWFPTSKGRFYQYEDFGLIGAVADLIDGGAIQVTCVDSVDEESLYAAHRHPAERLVRHDQYDRYLSGEVLPWLRGRAGGAKVATLGASFGAYHAVNFGFRHPDVVDKVVGFSGKYDIHSFLDGYWDDTAYFHCPTAYVPNMGPEWAERLSRLDICIVTGEMDNILEGSKRLIGILQAKGIPHRGHIWGAPYGHDWPWWKVQIRHYVP